MYPFFGKGGSTTGGGSGGGGSLLPLTPGLEDILAEKVIYIWWRLF